MAFYCVTFTKTAPTKRQGAEVIYWLSASCSFFALIRALSAFPAPAASLSVKYCLCSV